MGGFARAIGTGIGGFVGNAAAVVIGAIHDVVAQLQRVEPGGALSLVVIGLGILLVVWFLIRH